jgi:hypothetical protein
MSSVSDNDDLDALESGKKKRTLFRTPSTFTPGLSLQQSDAARRISDQFTPKMPSTTQRQRYVNALPSILRTSTKSKSSLQHNDEGGVHADSDAKPTVNDNSVINVQRARAHAGRDGTQRSKFVRDEDLGEEFMSEVDVTLRKQDYGEPGSTEYRKNREMATRPLAEKFGVARHKIVSDAEEGDVSWHMHVQQVIVGILHRVKEGHE